MQKKFSAWLLLFVLHMGMAWMLIAGVQYLMKNPSAEAEENSGQSFFGWEKADALFHDTIPGADIAMELRTKLSLAMGNRKIGDVYVSSERLLQEPSALDESALLETAQYINTFYAQYTIPTCLVAVPSATEIYTEYLPDHANVESQLTQMDAFYEMTDAQIRKMDAYHVLMTCKDDYIFYRTDSKWTSYGAYCVYRNIIRKMGYYPVSYDSYSITHVKCDFQGDLYEACLYQEVIPDILDVYTCENSSVIESMRSFDGMQWADCTFYNEEELEQENADAFYMGAPKLHTEIRTDVENGKRLLVIKDSYGDCMIPFLTQHYAQIDVIDINCLDRPLAELLNPAFYQQVLILCDADTFENTDAFFYLTEGTETGGEEDD